MSEIKIDFGKFVKCFPKELIPHKDTTFEERVND
jgi:hypothetical protein